MHKGEFVGNNAANQSKRILILGESHHWSEDKKEEDKLTTRVVEMYLEQYNSNNCLEKDRSYRFFDNIVQAFGYLPEKRTDFWNCVWFGNYIDEPCGVGDSKASSLLKRADKRKELNNQLFSFLRENEIDIVFCFSRRVYNHLPPLDRYDQQIKGNLVDSHRVDLCEYAPGPRKHIDETLVKPLTVYGLKHPSRGFSHQRYQEAIADILQKEGINWQLN